MVNQDSLFIERETSGLDYRLCYISIVQASKDPKVTLGIRLVL